MMKKMQSPCLQLIVLFLLSAHTSEALYLYFGEADFSLREDRSPLGVIVVSRGEFDGNITLQIIPMSVTQFIKQDLTPLPDSLGDLDHAESGADFNDSAITFTLQGTSSFLEKVIPIEVIDDDISEYEEVFLIVLKVLDAPEGLDIDMERNVSVARIRQDNDALSTKVGFNVGKLEVNEGDGQLNDTLFIEVEGRAEPTLDITLTVNNYEGNDLQLLQQIISIPSGVSRLPVPLEIIDDETVQDIITDIRIQMSRSSNQQFLFVPGDFSSVVVSVTDNERPHFGFQVNLPSVDNSTALELWEGRSTPVCVLLLEPEGFKTDIELGIKISPDSAAARISSNGLDLDYGYFFTKDDLKFCFNLTAMENNHLSEPILLTFSLVPKEVYSLPGEVERVDTDILEILIKDNDGVPKPPSDIELQLKNDAKDLLVTWKAEASALQPISHFRVSVRTADISSDRSRRQASVESSSDSEEFVTMDTQVLLEGVENDKTYIIQVCAENDLGHACASPKEFTIEREEGNVPVIKISSSGLNPGDKSSSLPKGYIALIILPVLVLLGICILLLSVLVCSCCRSSSKKYYPSYQEKKMEKQAEAMEGKYSGISRSESASSFSSSVSDFTPV